MSFPTILGKPQSLLLGFYTGEQNISQVDERKGPSLWPVMQHPGCRSRDILYWKKQAPIKEDFEGGQVTWLQCVDSKPQSYNSYFS